jgi:hypothetical protein
MCHNLGLKRIKLQQKLTEIFESKNRDELLSLDMELNLIISSALSYKHETVFRPFPTPFVTDNTNYTKSYNRIVSCLLKIPPILDWLKLLNTFDDDQILLLYWILFLKNFKLSLTSNINQV